MLAADWSLENEQRRLPAGAHFRKGPYPFLVLSFLSFQLLPLMLLGPIVDLFVTARTKEHQVLDGMGVCRSWSTPAASPIWLKGYNMGDLREHSLPMGDGMFKEILIAAIEFTPTACFHGQQKPGLVRNRS